MDFFLLIGRRHHSKSEFLYKNMEKCGNEAEHAILRGERAVTDHIVR